MKFITFSFDDGTVQDRETVRLFNKYGIHATFNLNSGLFGNAHSIPRYNKMVDHTELTAEQAKELYVGHEIAVHTRTHPLLQLISEEDRLKEINGDKECLEAVFGGTVTGMAYPGVAPNYDKSVVKTVREHTDLKYARTILETKSFDVPADFLEWHPTCHVSDEQIFELADRFEALDPDKDAIFYIWGHSFDLDGMNIWDHFEKLLARVSCMENVTIAPNREVYAYFNARH